MTVGAVALHAPRHEPLRASVRWALLFGNFVTGCGLMVVVGTLNDITRSLQVSVSTAGQLITIAAAVVCVGAPLLAGWVAGFDRRRLLTLAMLWYAAGHALCALMPTYAALWPLRAATLLAAAVFTPQAAAAISFMAPPAERGRHITSCSSAGRWRRCSACRWPAGSVNCSVGARRSSRSSRLPRWR